MRLFEPLFTALSASRVRYVVVGGLAVVLQGYPRLTADIDLILDLDPAAARRAMAAFLRLGFKPRAPVDPMDFADPARREAWIAEKGMMVFSLFSRANPMLAVDLFVRNPVSFDRLWARADRMRLGKARVRVASVEDLIAMKKSAGRPRDREDVAALRALKRARGRRRGRP